MFQLVYYKDVENSVKNSRNYSFKQYLTLLHNDTPR